MGFILFPTTLCGVLVFDSVLPCSAAASSSSSSRLLPSTHSLSTHSLSTHSLSTHSLSTHSLSTHSLSTHILSTHSLSTHSLSTHILSTHSLSTHSLSTHTLSTHTLSTHSLSTHSLSTHSLSTHSLPTHILSFCPHTLCPHTLCPHTLCPHTFCQHTHTLALGDIHLHFAWQAWHLVTFTVVLRGRRGTHGTGWRAWSGLVARGAAALCVVGVALGDIHLRFTWQAWHLATFTFVSRGRRGTHGTVWRAWSGLVARGAAALCVAGVALGDIHLRFTWQAWHLVTFTVVLRGRRGTHGTGWRAWSGLVARGAAALCVAGVALGDIHLRFTWQA